MLGLWLAILGLVFGSLCAFHAKKQERYTKNWFLIGFVSGPIGLLIIYLLPKLNEGIENNENAILSVDRI